MVKHILILFFLFGFSLVSKGQTPRLEIHHIGAGDGDGTLIIAIDTVNKLNISGQKYLDTSIILIDGQRSKTGGKEIWRYIKDTLNALSPTLKKINYIIVSHLHIDHYGGIPIIISMAEQAKWKIGKVIDRQTVDYKDYINGLNVVDSCYGGLSASSNDAASFKRYNDTLKKYDLYPTETVAIGENLFPQFTKIYMFCIVAYGVTASAGNSQRDTCFLPIVNKNSREYYTSKSENDLSIGFLLRFQGFNYLSAGDLAGVSGGNYIDGETPMTKGLLAGLKFPTDYHICAAKVSHHGSKESSSTWFAATNNFTLSVFPACLRSYGSSPNALPTKEAIQNLQSTGKDSLRYTFVPKNPGNPASYWTKGNFQYYNDVIIKILGNPGYDQNVNMLVIQRPKTKDMKYTLGAGKVETITCNKGHAW